MHNLDKAREWANGIRNASGNGHPIDADCYSAAEVIQSLPNLPEPDYDTGAMVIWDHVCHSVTYNKFLGVSLIAEVNERSLPIDEARNIAYALLAAAKLAEENS